MQLRCCAAVLLCCCAAEPILHDAMQELMRRIRCRSGTDQGRNGHVLVNLRR